MAGAQNIGDSAVAQTPPPSATPDASAKLSQESNQIGMTGIAGDAARLAIVTGDGILHAPQGLLHAGENAIENWQGTLATIGGSAIVGAALKAVLPEAGPVGAIAGLGMGVYFGVTAAPDFIKAYGEGLDAKTWGQMNDAGAHLGDATGNLAASLGEGYVGYRLGAGVADKVLINEKFDNFSEWKQDKWNSAMDFGKSHLPNQVSDFFGVDKSASTAASLGLKPHYVASADGTKATLMDSMRKTPVGTDMGPTDVNQPMNATITLNRLNSGLTKDRYIRRMSLGKAEGLTDENDAFQKKFGASQESLDAVTKFAAKHGLNVDQSDLRSGNVLLSGKTGDFGKAFNTEIRNYMGDDGKIHPGRSGALSYDADLTPHVKSVMGIDERPFGEHYSKLLPVDKVAAVAPNTAEDAAATSDASAPKPKAQPQGYLATDIAKAQNFDLSNGGKGQRGAFVAFGGGIQMADYMKFYDENGLQRPNPLGIKLIDGAKNVPDGPNGADGEDRLDAYQMQTLAPKAQVDMLLAPNTDQGFNDAFVRGIFPAKGEQQASVVSGSWGSNESVQTKQAVNTLSDTFKDGVIRNVQVLSASGDTGAKDGAKTNEVDYPASDPNVTGVGGLKMVLDKNGKLTSTTAWNEGEDSSTGGGISKLFKLPTWQAAFNKIMNLDTGKPGRGVPDISTDADPATGFRVRIDGKEYVIGGTSDAAPLYGGMLLNINSTLADHGIKPVTPLNPWMYARGNDNKIFKDVTSGGNNGYMTAKGWDPVTGLGWVDGTAMQDAMLKNQTVNVGSAAKVAARFSPRGVNLSNENAEQNQSGQ